MTDHRIVHRFIPSSFKHGNKTACGIRLSSGPMTAGGMIVSEAVASDGSYLVVTVKGKPFDCKRCRVVLERHHTKETA